MKGKLITVEGIDGSGKTTISKILHERIDNSILTCEPTNGWIGKIIKKKIVEELDGITVALLFSADRNEHVKEIKNWMTNGKIVICDRYIDSTMAYQKEQIKEKDIEKWLYSMQKYFPKPDLTILIKLEAKKAIERIKRKKIFFEDEDFLRNVQKNYLEIAKKEKRFFIVDGEKMKEEIVDECMEEIKKRKII